MEEFSTPKKHGYREGGRYDSNMQPAEAIRGTPPQLMSADMSDLTAGRTKGNLTDMLNGIPDATKKAIGME